MYSIDPVAAIKGAQSMGYYSMSRWSANDTLAFQTYTGISQQSRKDAARYLRFMNGGCSILATDLECSKVEVDSNPPLVLSFKSGATNRRVRKTMLL